MNAGVIAPIILILAVGLVFVSLLRPTKGEKTRECRDPDAEIRRIRTMTNPDQIRKVLRKWSNPEIRQAAARQLPVQETAKLLTMLTDREQRDLLSHIKDFESLETIRSYCSGSASSEVSSRIRSLYYEKIADAPDPDWLVSLIRGDLDKNIRAEAAEALEDRKSVVETALWAASVSDEKLLHLMLGKLEQPAAGNAGTDSHPDGSAVAAAIAENPAYPYKMRIAAVSHVWDLETLDRLSADRDLPYECARQRCEVICREEGHQWEMVPEDILDMPARQVGRDIWRVPDYRCRKCGLRRQGERSKGEWIRL